MIQVLLGVLAVAGLAIMFLWLKIKNAASSEAALKGELDQRAADEKLKVNTELERRDAESKERVDNAQEAINRRRAAIDELWDN
jgi:hypothetical protein